jgi:hypothetical protein
MPLTQIDDAVELIRMEYAELPGVEIRRPVCGKFVR